MSLAALRQEKPAWVERLEQNGKLESVLVPETNLKLHLIYYLIGFNAVAFGLFLLIAGLVNSPYITW